MRLSITMDPEQNQLKKPSYCMKFHSYRFIIIFITMIYLSRNSICIKPLGYNIKVEHCRHVCSV
jgi:hypothetical protein